MTCSRSMAQVPPTWLDQQFIVTVLQGGIDSKLKVEVVKFSASPAVAAGNNYLSHLYRVPIKYKIGNNENSTTFIIKVPIQNSFLSELSNDENYDFFDKEPKVYKELLPKMKEKINLEFGPESFYCPLKNGLVLKDLKLDGYIMCDRFKQLDYEHCKITITTVAKFHAASVACQHENADLIQDLGKERMFDSGKQCETEMKQWLYGCIKNVLDIIDEIEDCKPVARLINERIDELAESFQKSCQPKSKGLNVLNHGDLWINNIMFKYNNSEEVTDVKLIDYQLGRYVSPVIDLLYFIWTSTNEDVRSNRVKDLLDIYLRTLNQTLEQLGCDERLTDGEMLDDLKSSINYVIVIICQYFPMMLCDAEDTGIVNLEEIKVDDIKNNQNDERFMKMYKGKHFASLIPNLMKQFHTWVSTIS